MSCHQNHHHCSENSGCHCSCHSSCCCQHAHSHCCSGSSNHENECHHGQMFLELANEAWMEVLKEKIKDEIKNNEHSNGKLNQLAKIVSTANSERWKKKMENKKSCQSYEQQLIDFFGADHCKNCH